MMSPRSFIFNKTQSTSSPIPETQTKTNNAKPSFVKTKTTDKNYVKAATLGSKVQHHQSDMSVSVMTMNARPLTTAPLFIPNKSQYEVSNKTIPACEERATRRTIRRHADIHASPRGSQIHSPDAIPPSVAALLAMTAIPQRKRNPTRRLAPSSQRLTVDAVLRHTKGQESEYSLSIPKSPMDILLNTSDDDGDLDTLGSDPGNDSYLSLRSMSTESMPSLVESSTYDSSVSLPSLLTPSPGGSPKRRRRIQSISSPTRQNTLEHPLSDTETEDVYLNSLDFTAFSMSPGSCDKEDTPLTSVPSRRSIFKSNLTASLKALRATAISFSNMTTPMLTPDDFLTRSIITIDPRVPFTDERMPPRLFDVPTPALRRYLNPTTHAVPESQIASTSTKCTASIQMQTYKVYRGTKGQHKTLNRSNTAVTACSLSADLSTNPIIRPREMRENSDFIRIAVLEMIMRKNGKLDSKVPGHAKWALPPRQTSSQIYKVSQDGVPVRWIAMTA